VPCTLHLHAHDHTKIDISLVDALVGFTTYVTLLNGEQLAVTRTAVTYDGFTQTYIGHGCPVMGGAAADAPTVRSLLDVKYDVWVFIK
jgi:DnaJ-class molecular chaperone